jgi:hippurate hydrolase
MIAGVERARQGGRDDGGAPPGDQDQRRRQGVINDDALAARSARGTEGGIRRQGAADGRTASASEDYSEFIMAGVPSFYFGIGGLIPGSCPGEGQQYTMPGNHLPEFAPVPSPPSAPASEAMIWCCWTSCRRNSVAGTSVWQHA